MGFRKDGMFVTNKRQRVKHDESVIVLRGQFDSHDYLNFDFLAEKLFKDSYYNAHIPRQLDLRVKDILGLHFSQKFVDVQRRNSGLNLRSLGKEDLRSGKYAVGIDRRRRSFIYEKEKVKFDNYKVKSMDCGALLAVGRGDWTPIAVDYFLGKHFHLRRYEDSINFLKNETGKNPAYVVVTTRDSVYDWEGVLRLSAKMFTNRGGMFSFLPYGREEVNELVRDACEYGGRLPIKESKKS